MSKSRKKHNRFARSKSKGRKQAGLRLPGPGFRERFNVFLKALEIGGFILGIYMILQGSYVFALWLGVLLGFGIAYLFINLNLKLAGVAVVLVIAGILIQPHLPIRVALHGWLVPANDPTPPNACGEIPKAAVLLIAGNSAGWSTKFPMTVVKIGDDDMLTMNDEGGRIELSGKFFSADGSIVAELKDNEYYINPNNYFCIERPDRHSLIVYDQQDVKMLDARYINPHTVIFAGVIRHPPETVVISKMTGIFSNTICFGNDRVAFKLGR